MISTPLMINIPGPLMSAENDDSNLPPTYINHSQSLSYDNPLYDRVLPMALKGTSFGDNLYCVTINLHGSGEYFQRLRS